jgi:hypothetical protein
MSENQQEQAAIVGFILAATKDSEQLINFGNQLFPPHSLFFEGISACLPKISS